MMFNLIYTYLFIVTTFTAAEVPKFRIFAPEFICPKDEDIPIEKPDNTIITLQIPAGATFDVAWTVRWTPLVTPSQRFTLLVWKTVRELEKKLNRQQPEPYVYVIPNDELLQGVNYEFNVTAVEGSEVSSPKVFHIDNTQGENRLDLVEGRADMISVVLLGAQVAYADAEHILEAQLTSCFPTQDYYFIWTVRSIQGEDVIDVSAVKGSRLVLPAHSLKVGHEYDADCQVIKQSTGLKITETGLPFKMLRRPLEVYLNVDYLVVPANHQFYIEAKVVNHDYYETPVTFEWECTFEGAPCVEFDDSYNETLLFPSGLTSLGEHKIKLTVNVLDETAETSAVVKTVEQTLPVIQITAMSRIINEDYTLTLVANASNVAPTCSLAWYFATEDYLNGAGRNDTCEDCQHGEALSDTLTIYSLEENFLTELADFTNETEWRQVIGEMAAKAGRARFMATCGCSITFECTTKGLVYADLWFEINVKPKAGNVKVTPSSGSALETAFRISTLAVADENTPLRYSFYCRVGDNDTLLLASFDEYLAVETFLPYIDGGTDVWVEVCDALGACSTGSPTTVILEPGDGSTVDLVIDDVTGHSRRCEIDELWRDSGVALVTYTNAERSELISKFTAGLLEALPPGPGCMINSGQYTNFLTWLSSHGVNTAGLQ